MGLIFRWKDIKNRNHGLTFDDVLLVPERSDVRSRRDPLLKTKLTKSIELDIPLIAANMDTITETDMALAMDREGGLGILHRFMSIEDQVSQVQLLKEKGLKNISASVGVGEEAKNRCANVVSAGANIITVDIAHGHNVQMSEMVQWIKNEFNGVQIIAGNIATPSACIDLIEAGADALKVGIGPGSMCTTRIITGCGVPQLTAVALCAEAAQSRGIPLIADGGIKTSGDIVKALAAGADAVMLGSLLAGTFETPGEIKKGKKHYRGMASKSAQVSWRGELPKGMAAEGEATQVAVKGRVQDVVLELTGGIRSGMSYLNAESIHEIRDNAQFMEMSPLGIMESRAHGI